MLGLESKLFLHTYPRVPTHSLTPQASECNAEVTSCFRFDLATNLSVGSGYYYGSFHIAEAFWGGIFSINTKCNSFASENST